MRRSLAPSQRGKVLPASTSSTSCPPSCRKQDADDEVTIQRLPMFGFLEVPEALNKQFKVPSGCIITEKTLELRKQKRLGNSNSFRVIRPGDLAKGIFRVTTNFQDPTGDEEDADEEQLPTSVKDLPPFEPLVLWTDPNDPTNKVEVIPELACRLRPHQREGVQFLFECTMGLRGFEGQGCILADDMGLGKTLMSITALWTLLNQGFVKGEPAVKKVMVVCPTSLVGNWDNEIRKWVGDHCPTFAVKQEPKKVIKNFLMHRGKGVLIVSYETQRLYFKLFEEAAKKSTLMMPTSTTTTVYSPVCDLIICDEAHKLKNAESELSKCLNALPARKRILLSGTPMQNELTEFFNMVNFCNPNVLGTVQEFRRRYERPILASREPDALESEVQEAGRLQKELSVIVNEFILKRGNILNAQHLPPKLVQFVCCRLTPLQEAMYERLLSSKEIRHIREGKQTNTLNSIRQLINICSHPQLILDQYQRKLANREEIDDDLAAMVEMIPKTGISVAPKPPPSTTAASSSFASRMEQLKSRSQMGHHPGKSSGGGFASDQFIDPEQSGKMAVLFRMMQAMRAVQRGERIVVVSNYTSTLDLIDTMCQQQKWPVLRLDGTISATKRTKLVDDFNNPHSGAFAFLLSSKAGGCGINLIGGNRLVLFDPDWNPASDKQAAGRIWREGQKRRCFIYRFMSTGSIEEKIIQRQLSKEGLVDIVDDKEQVNQFSSDELRQLFTLLKDTRSDTHDTLMCPRCTFVKQKRGAAGGGGGGKGSKMSEAQQQACLKFLSEFEGFLQQETVAFQQREAIRLQAAASASPGNEALQTLVKKATAKVYETLPFHDRIAALAQRVRDQDFDSLTAYSRRQREIFQEIENDLKGDLNDIYEAEDHVARPATPGPDDDGGGGSGGASSAMAMAIASHDSMLHYFSSSFSIYAQFLRQWTDIVPSLMALAHVTTARDGAGDDGTGGAGGSDVANEGSDCVEQEGCPEETDLNKWSHHCCPLSCDDELFAKALGDDDALVSFIFGLEVNWSLLEQREAETRDEKERRKVQQIKDLEELNARRRAQKEKLARGEVSDDPDGDEGNGDELGGGGGGKKKAKTTKKGASDGAKGKAAKSKKTAAADGAAASKKRKRIAEEDEDSINDEEDDEDGGDDGDDDEKDIDGPSASDDERPAPKKASTKSKRSSDGATMVASPSPAMGKRLSRSKLDDATVAVAVAPSKKAAKPSTAAATMTTTTVPPMVFPEEDPASFDFDVFFDQDRKKLHKLLAKGKLHIPTFDLFWKVLKTENNDWRCMLTPDGVEVFSRTPGLKIADIRKYKRNMDYFVEIPGLLNHFILQCQLRDDHVMAGLLQQLLEPSSSSSATLPTGTAPPAPAPATAAASAASASAAVDAKPASSSSVVPPATASTSTSTTKALVVAAADAHRRSKSPVAAVAASKKRVIQLSDDEGDSDDQQASTVPPPPTTALAAAKKKTIVLDDDSDDDVNVAVTNVAAASEATSLAMKPSAPSTPPRRITPTTDDDIISFDTPDDSYFQDEPAAAGGGGRRSSSSSGHKRKRETLASALAAESSSSPPPQQQQQQQQEEVLPPSASKRKLKFDFQSDHEDGARPSTSSDKENRVTEVLNHNGDTSSAKKRSRTSPEHLESLLTPSVSSVSASKAVSFPSLPDASQSSSHQSCSQEGPWTCEVCTFINENPAYVKKCQICKTKRFGSQRLAKRELQQLSQQV